MPELLYTLAEISIAFVGFAAIFGVLSLRAETWPPEVRFMFRALIEVGLIALSVSVLPMALASFGLRDDELWLAASVMALAIGLAITGWRIYLIRKYLLQPPREAPFLFVIPAVGFVLLAGNVAWQAPGPYLIAVLTSLGAASAIFLAMIYRMFPVGPPDDKRHAPGANDQTG